MKKGTVRHPAKSTAKSDKGLDGVHTFDILHRGEIKIHLVLLVFHQRYVVSLCSAYSKR